MSAGGAGYEPLPGRAYGPLYSCRLYMGRDHLLKSTAIGFHENLRRFAWEDIQAVILRETPTGQAINAVLGACLLTLAIFYLNYAGRGHMAWMGYLPFFLTFLGLLVMNIRLGPTCRVHIQTAVSFETLPPLYRVKVAREAIAMMLPRIAGRQAAEAYAPAAPTAQLPPPPGRPIGGLAWHASACAFLALILALQWLDLIHATRPLLAGALAAFFAGMLFSLGVLIAQVHRSYAHGLGIFGWLNFSYYMLGSVLLMTVVFSALAESAGKGGFRLRHTGWWDAYTHAGIALATLLLAFGLMATGRHALAAGRRASPPPGGS